MLLLASVEGLINLIYELYLLPTYRDPRLSDKFVREDIDVKIRLAPKYCRCFSVDQIDHTTDAFRRYHTLVNKRNDFVHGNITDPRRYSIIVEDDRRLLLDPKGRFDDAGFPNTAEDLRRQDIERAQEIVDGLVGLVRHSLADGYDDEFEVLISYDLIHVEIGDNGEYSIDMTEY